MKNKPEYHYPETDFSHYTYEVGYYLPYEWDSEEEKKNFVPYVPVTDHLVWNVIDTTRGSNSKVEVFNIFDHGSFAKSLLDIKKKYKTFEEFAEHVRRELHYYFWSKSEWEVIITTWPPYIDAEELDRLNKEREDNIKNYGHPFRCTDVRLKTGEKIDICDQVMMNWDQFINYLWNNRKLITKKKLGITW